MECRVPQVESLEVNFIIEKQKKTDSIIFEGIRTCFNERAFFGNRDI